MRKNIGPILVAVLIPLLILGTAFADNMSETDTKKGKIIGTPSEENGIENDSILLNFTDRDTIAIVMDFCLNELYLNRAAACGIVANMTAESGLRTYALGDMATSYGLCQWHNERWYRLKEYAAHAAVPEYDIGVQLDYFRWELETCFPNLYGELKNIPDNEDGAYKAGYIFCTEYEKPEYTDLKGDSRGKWGVSEYRSGRTYEDENITEKKIIYMLHVRAGDLNIGYIVPVGGFAMTGNGVSVDYSPDFWKAELDGWDNSWIGGDEDISFTWMTDNDPLTMAFQPAASVGLDDEKPDTE